MGQITIEQRYVIQSLLSVGVQQEEIVTQIGKDKPIVNRKIKHNVY